MDSILICHSNSAHTLFKGSKMMVHGHKVGDRMVDLEGEGKDKFGYGAQNCASIIRSTAQLCSTMLSTTMTRHNFRHVSNKLRPTVSLVTRLDTTSRAITEYHIVCYIFSFIKYY